MGHIKSKQRGFTIVEVLIVVVVIAILAAITIVAYNGIQNRAKTSAAINASAQATKKLATAAVANNETYPQDKTDFLAVTGLNEASGVIYEYTSTSPYTSYCLTTTSNSLSYFTTNTDQKPTAGGCPGHSINGVGVITNLSVNPSFEVSNAGLASLNVTNSRQSSGADTGSTFIRSTRNVATSSWGPWWDAVPSGINEGQSYSVAIRAKSNVTASRDLRIEWRSAGGTNISTSNLQATTLGTSWSTMSGTAVAPTGAVGIRLTLYSVPSGTTSDYVDIDSIMVTQTTTPQQYADGTTPNWAWMGTAHNSASRGVPL